MSVSIAPGALGRPPEEFLVAVELCAEEWRRDTGNMWVGGMVAAAWWICGHTPHPPMTPDRDVIADGDEIASQLLLAGTARLAQAEPASSYARGVYRMLTYAAGYSDELPLSPTRPAPVPR
ncbi:hypothetical protein ACGFIP_32330 [Micromonospora zamorensis]|uniref:hypothetical protein n=1 Tax=Micromonospora zamorensis TaxID=709883 RepID=UPI0037116BBA